MPAFQSRFHGKARTCPHHAVDESYSCTLDARGGQKASVLVASTGAPLVPFQLPRTYLNDIVYENTSDGNHGAEKQGQGKG
jgi:hypothetical protein